MKQRKCFLACVALLLSGHSFAQAETDDTDRQVFSIVAAPGEDASRQMRISWGTDTLLTETYVKYRKAGDRKERHVRKVYPQQQERCDVFYGKSSKNKDNENFIEEALFTKCGAELRDLRPDTEYEYEIATPNGKSYGPYRFKTAGAKSWSCCIISDFHSYPPLGNRLKSAMNMIETVRQYDDSMDWILHLGDVCAWGGSYSFWQRMYREKPFHDCFWAGVNGNHDNMSRTSELSNQYFRNTSYYPENGYEGEKGVCYHFRYGNALFLMLNNEDMHTDEGLSAAQQWVRDVVETERAGRKAPTYIIVCEHYQWFYGDNGKTSQSARWSSLFDELGVDLALSGNNHIYLRTGILYQGTKTDGTRGTMYLQTSASDCERGRAMEELTANQDIIESRFTEGQRTISALDMQVDGKGITLTLLNREGKVLDNAFIPAKR